MTLSDIETQNTPKSSGPLTVLFVVAVIAATIGLGVAVILNARRAVDNPGPLYGEAPSFTLTDQNGETFSSDQLAGKVYLVQFFFTRCELVCPTMVRQMAKLQQELKQALGDDMASVHLISISVDGEHDTPEAIRNYPASQDLEIDWDTWTMLTGPKDEVWPLVEQGFQLPVEQQPDVELMPIGHSTRVVVVDQDGQIQNYIDGMSTPGREQLLETVKDLINR